MVKNIDQFITTVTAGFTPKQKEVIFGRFGLKSGARLTLQEIGDKLGITRERVRQIEEGALKKVSGTVVREAGDFVNEVQARLIAHGGVRRDDAFIPEIRQAFFDGVSTKYLDQKIRFVFLTAGAPHFERETDTMRAYWYAGAEQKKEFTDFVKAITGVFKNGNRDELIGKKAYLAHCTDASHEHFITIPKHFGTNVFGDFGLTEWAEISPKTVRDKAYLVLKRESKPLHFETIAKSINKLGIDRKPAHIQTVHNELIKDQRFVLVGRGIYGLREHGYQPGTVREVIARLLKSNGPLHANDVLAMVGKERILKTNTVLLSLQNRKHFKRLHDGRYHVKEA